VSDTLRWWAVSAGTEDRGEGERDGRIRAATEERARELYLSQRPAHWVIWSIEPATAPEVIDPNTVAEATAAEAERRIRARQRADAQAARRKPKR